MKFPTTIDEILKQVDAVDPVKYARTRNFTNGAVTRLSPYISRGVISTRLVLERVMKKGYALDAAEKFIQELLWRDFFQYTALQYPTLYQYEIRNTQPDVKYDQVPAALLDASTGIEALDQSITALYETGYMHNHCRMYVASLTCNIGKTHWLQPSRWMYYHLLDADFASNACSWQWVCGSFSNKKYYANQENINKYCGTGQRNTFLDTGYDSIDCIPVPAVMQTQRLPELKTVLPDTHPPLLDPSLPTLIYNAYNLDPFWRKEMKANRILLLEPSHFEKFPVAPHTIEFICSLAANIPGIQIFTGEFTALKALTGVTEFYCKEHPLFRHYEAKADARDWICPDVQGSFPSFFSYWNKCSRIIRRSFISD